MDPFKIKLLFIELVLRKSQRGDKIPPIKRNPVRCFFLRRIQAFSHTGEAEALQGIESDGEDQTENDAEDDDLYCEKIV